MQDFTGSVVTKAHSLEIQISVNQWQLHNACGIAIFRLLGENLVGTLQSGERLGQLSADLDDLHDRSDEEAHEQRCR